MTGVVVFLLGVAALIVSAGVAWMVTRITRTRPVEGAWLLTIAGVLLLMGLIDETEILVGQTANRLP